MIVDSLGRQFKNLRVSITAACNYACVYCVPNGQRLVAAQDELDGDSLAKAVSLLQKAAGVERIRITGGEPLVSPRLEPFIRALNTLHFDDVSLTTNGQLLQKKLPILIESPIRRLNISLDSMAPESFKKMARGGDLATVLKGVAAAADAGFSIKINMVPYRQFNGDQIMPMLNFALDHGYELRFIELMRMGHLHKAYGTFQQAFIGHDEILDLIGNQYQYHQTEATVDATAVRYEIPGKGFFGVIANESIPFCRTCTRLRLSSTGWLHGCLSSSKRHFMGGLLHLPEEEALSALRPMLFKALHDKQSISFAGGQTIMKIIGG